MYLRLSRKCKLLLLAVGRSARLMKEACFLCVSRYIDRGAVLLCRGLVVGISGELVYANTFIYGCLNMISGRSLADQWLGPTGQLLRPWAQTRSIGLVFVFFVRGGERSPRCKCRCDVSAPTVSSYVSRTLAVGVVVSHQSRCLES